MNCDGKYAFSFCMINTVATNCFGKNLSHKTKQENAVHRVLRFTIYGFVDT